MIRICPSSDVAHFIESILEVLEGLSIAVGTLQALQPPAFLIVAIVGAHTAAVEDEGPLTELVIADVLHEGGDGL